MNVFDLRRKLVDDYREYTLSFIKILDRRIKDKVTTEMDAGAFWPEPLLQLNPNYRSGGTIDDMVDDGTLHPSNARIFRFDKSDSDPYGKQLRLHMHQREAILKAKESKSYVLTSGTGSGKSLTYIIPIVDHVLRNGVGRGIQAIVVYPMNALANSQYEELSKFLGSGLPDDNPGITFARYTGQEKDTHREQIRANPPDILLTNYVMLELMLTRREDRELIRATQDLRFLVFDELHTYRGRQGADVAMLIRRCRLAFGSEDMICIGTSATMASEGTSDDQKLAVANVAQTMFGVPFGPDQIIGETLERSTPEIGIDDRDALGTLRETIDQEKEPPVDFEDFKSHPLSSWIESTFGIQTEEETGTLVRQIPRRLEGATLHSQSSASDELAELTSTPATKCANVLKSFLMQGAALRRGPESRYPIFAFRLHQFFTRGDTVWSTLESEETRHLEMSKKGCQPGEPDKPLFPLVFCRQCGAAYYRVTVLRDSDGTTLIPRDDGLSSDEDEGTRGYLFVSDESPWPPTEGKELLDRLPSFLRETVGGEERILADQRKYVPTHVYVNTKGEVVSEGQGTSGAIVEDNFLFCLNPHCGIVYNKRQRSERAKLATLGVDNRSTATTILALRSLIELQSLRELPSEARKLLSFTDNRQDASLQAGHFNDFTQVALLRSALYRALLEKGDQGLTHGLLANSVFDALQLRFEEYAADPDVRGPARESTNDALRRVIQYYLYRDLERGWRVTAPNLEDCGLLVFDYLGLTGSDGLLAEDELWEEGISTQVHGQDDRLIATPLALASSSSTLREEIVRTLLDMLRKELAVKVDVLDRSRHAEFLERTNPRLLENTVWHQDDPKDLVSSVVAYPRSKRPNEHWGSFVSSFGRFGHYLKRVLMPHCQPSGIELRRDDLDEIIRFLFLALKRYGILEQVRNGDDPGYQINVDCLRWKAGTGESRPADHTRLIDEGEISLEVNRYFVECYKRFVDLRMLFEAREHTAQVSPEDRQDREDRFREAHLPLLFCSPTMELGVDIAQLNLVNMRNVPPTAANYAQRSGRAGRGGQPALVFTYCAGRSPHDQFYFRHPTNMVGGSVIPPRIDIGNRDLIRTHIHAVWMEMAKPDLGKTLTTVLETAPDGDDIPLVLRDPIRADLGSAQNRARALERSESLLATIADELSDSNWFGDNWAREQLVTIEREFDRACDRWRNLYRAAVRQREFHHRIIGNPARPESERNQSRRLRAQAESQLRLLTEAEGVFEGDFYSYRYFASEGFLPGYNFPRLPLSAYVPSRRLNRGRDEFISRPRFLAISEFGPKALVYHEGSRYQVHRVNLDFGSSDPEAAHHLVTSILKRCEHCGYAHLETTGSLTEICHRCGHSLEVSAEIPNLVRMQNVSLMLAKRITCDEEERQRRGYNLVTSYRFPVGEEGSVHSDANVHVDGQHVMKLIYADTTELYRINLGWSRSTGDEPPGFNLDLERGTWQGRQSQAQDADAAGSAQRIQRVVPYVSDAKNALVMSFDTPGSDEEMASLQAAFKEAILKFFQLEPRELVSEPMPSHEDRKEILFYEASEGGAGVLRQIVRDPKILPALARCALEICHFDPDTLEDLASERCGNACYECLLDYGNQLDHRLLDRQLIKDRLADLSKSTCSVSGGKGSRSERIAELCRRCDSKLEKDWLVMVDSLKLVPPSDAQYLIKACSTRPDFFYGDHNAAIYIDGPPHDEPHQIKKDEEITDCLMEHGYAVIRFHHKDDWKQIFKSHVDIFGEISE